jgi:RimJ/RimL family protein N-acetyltransferase
MRRRQLSADPLGGAGGDMPTAEDPIHIRRGALDDVEGIWLCIDTAVRDGWFTFVDPPPVDAVRSSISPNSIIFVLECDSRVVGWCDITPKDENGLGDTGTLGMALLPDFRDRGLGRRLLSATVEGAATAGISRVELRLLASNKRAQALYERFGFALEGRERVTREIGQQPVDILSMAIVGTSK